MFFFRAPQKYVLSIKIKLVSWSLIWPQPKVKCGSVYKKSLRRQNTIVPTTLGFTQTKSKNSRFCVSLSRGVSDCIFAIPCCKLPTSEPSMLILWSLEGKIAPHFKYNWRWSALGLGWPFSHQLIHWDGTRVLYRFNHLGANHLISRG